MDNRDSFAVRRAYLEHGGNAGETARALSADGKPITRQGVMKHVQRAGRLQPLTYQQGEPEDRKAMSRFVRAQLERVGIALPGRE